MTFFIQHFILYEFIDGILKHNVKKGYGVIFPNNKIIINLYENNEIKIYDSYHEFNAIYNKGNRHIEFIKVYENNQYISDDDE